MRKNQIFLASLALCLFFTGMMGTAAAAVPTLLSLQGKVTNYTTGGPVTSGDIKVEIYSTSTAGLPIFNETHSSAVQNTGIFDVLVGSRTNLEMELNNEYYLEVYVNNQEVIGDGVNNRSKFTASGGEIDGADIKAGTIDNTKVAFNYAGSSSKGGDATTANDLSCTDCIGGTEIDETSLSGTASALTVGDVSCTNCLTATEVASSDYATSSGNADTVDGKHASELGLKKLTWSNPGTYSCSCAPSTCSCVMGTISGFTIPANSVLLAARGMWDYKVNPGGGAYITTGLEIVGWTSFGIIDYSPPTAYRSTGWKKTSSLKENLDATSYNIKMSGSTPVDNQGLFMKNLQVEVFYLEL